MDANHQTANLLGPLAGADVTLNIGLSVSNLTPSRRTVAHRLRELCKALPQMMEPGYISELHMVPQRIWTGEPLLIVQGTFKEDIASSLLVWDTLVNIDQDCIAIYCHNDFPGLSYSTLFGPASDDWGQFNINFFTFIGDKHD